LNAKWTSHRKSWPLSTRLEASSFSRRTVRTVTQITRVTSARLSRGSRHSVCVTLDLGTWNAGFVNS